MRRVLITGANRGLGLEMTRQCLAAGDRVFASCRDVAGAPELRGLAAAGELTVLEMDLKEPAQIVAALAEVRRRTEGLDLLLNNAGVMPEGENPTNLDPDTMLDTFRVNCVGPMIVVREALPLLKAAGGAKILDISSQLGSLENKTSGGLYSYCATKAALNMLSRTLAHDLRRFGITVVAIHPGWVQTDMGGRRAPLAPEDAVRGILSVAASAGLEDSGKFLTWEGAEHPW